jgi:hypothetical protein
MAEKEVRNFALRDKDGNEIGVFTGKQPRQAALKAANRGHTDIRLRERGTKKIHVFTGERKQIKKPKGAPNWMPAKIWKPMVKKVGVEKLEKLETGTEKVVVVKRGGKKG